MPPSPSTPSTRYFPPSSVPRGRDLGRLPRRLVPRGRRERDGLLHGLGASSAPSPSGAPWSRAAWTPPSRRRAGRRPRARGVATVRARGVPWPSGSPGHHAQRRLSRGTPAAPGAGGAAGIRRGCAHRREGQPSGAGPPRSENAPGTSMPPQVGQVINNKYRLLRLIGDGGMGSVYEARHEALGTTRRAQVPPPRVLAARGPRAALPPGGAGLGADPEPARGPRHRRRPDAGRRRLHRARVPRGQDAPGPLRGALPRRRSGSRTPTRSTTRCRCSRASRPRTGRASSTATSSPTT